MTSRVELQGSSYTRTSGLRSRHVVCRRVNSLYVRTLGGNDIIAGPFDCDDGLELAQSIADELNEAQIWGGYTPRVLHLPAHRKF